MLEAQTHGGRIPVDLLVRHGYLITMDADRRLIPDGAIAIRGKRILAVGPDHEIAARHTAAREIDAAGAPVHPGFIECHMHASFQLYRGALPDHLAEGDAFDSVEAHFYNNVTDEEEYLSVLLSAIEMVRNGTTCFLEAGTILTPDAAARAAEFVGIRAILADPFIWDQPQGFAQGKVEVSQDCAACASHGRVKQELKRAPKTKAEALARLGQEIKRNATADALVTGHVAILGLGTATEDLMMQAKSCADRAGVVLNLHQSYSAADTEADRSRFGKDPLLHLAEIGFLDRNITFGHGNHFTDAECEVFIDRGASIAWAPAASMMWGHGSTVHGRHAELYRRGGNIALGSDSANWSNDFDLWRQASLAVMSAREAHEDRTYLVAEDGIEMATLGGARATGMPDRIGSLEPGKYADLVIHTLDRPELVPVTDMIRGLFYAARSKSVHTVIINGKVVLDAGVFPAFRERELLREIGKASAALLKRMGVTPEPNRIARPGCAPGAKSSHV
ncbi:amidohydrolase family protein [Dongia sedimenti]|uniref:Amidohydrolase family protein n=1 Tax=Dongia sedimenti TaxID=3064282 RepID=A0ABU0YRL5_9PROT|nr:amidohydrolase family protein [Rhodospirillaceae bacterium R-7]